MGRAVAEAAVSAGLQLIPVTFSNSEKSREALHVGSTQIQIYGPPEREHVLSSIFNEHPNVVVVDYTVPDAVNGKYKIFSLSFSVISVPFLVGIFFTFCLLQRNKTQAPISGYKYYLVHLGIIEFLSPNLHTKGLSSIQFDTCFFYHLFYTTNNVMTEN